MLRTQDSDTPRSAVFRSLAATPATQELKAAATAKTPYSIVIKVRTGASEHKTESRLGRPIRAVALVLRCIPLLLAFHALNSVLGAVACVTVVTGTALSVAFLPLCGFGVVAFQMLVLATEKLAQLDVTVANLASCIGGCECAEDVSGRLRLHPAITSEFTLRLDAGTRRAKAKDGNPVAPPRSPASPQTLLAMVYFVTVKLAVSILSFLVAAFVLCFPLLVVPGSGPPELLAISEREYDEKPFACVLTAAGIFALGLALLLLFAVLSRELTDFVCGDPEPMEVDEQFGVRGGRERSGQRRPLVTATSSSQKHIALVGVEVAVV
ncbi:hypothetical protein PybrP1_008063 [[Pythium] brassicae (nom. inval.)]|nr:hypothetical protein PybrP1_008063 [[Pythium] brassicae (nom. inval.)]